MTSWINCHGCLPEGLSANRLCVQMEGQSVVHPNGQMEGQSVVYARMHGDCGGGVQCQMEGPINS